MTPPATLRPLALYLHFPWCIRKCPYCDFNSHQAVAGFSEQDYLDALHRDLESSIAGLTGRPFSSVFMGGGTPSLFSPQGIGRLLSSSSVSERLVDDAEITLEVNPGTVERGRLGDYRAVGVNRLSLGIQSFDRRQLEALGRVHDDHQAHAAIAEARTCFDNFNLDLMYGLPGQTIPEALLDLEQALQWEPTHLSCYQLTIEPHTAFHHAPPSLPPHDIVADMGDALEIRLEQAGYRHYETSAFAKPGRECRHNLNYWQFGDYLGVGAGAHGKLTDQDGIHRESRYRNPRAYMDGLNSGRYCEQRISVPKTDLPFEFMMNALRLVGGFEKTCFERQTGLDWAVMGVQMAALSDQGWIVDGGDRIQPTERGRRFLNDLLGKFMG